MDDNIVVVQQKPPGLQRAFAVVRQDARFFQCRLNIIRDTAYLARALAGTDNKKVRERAYFTDIQQYDVACLLFRGRINCFTG